MRRLTWVALVGALVGCEAKGEAASAHEPAGPAAEPAGTMSSGQPAGTGSPHVPEGEGFKGGLRGPSHGADRGLDPSRGGAEAPIPQAAFTLPNLQNCQSNCLAANRMKAVGPEQLDEDCKAECKTSCLSECNSQTDAGKKACKADCERQAARVH